MTMIRAVVREWRLEVRVPADWADGTEVVVRPAHEVGGDDPDRPPTPEEIAAVLAAMEKIEPLDMTDEDRAEADRWEKGVNDYGKANMDKGIEAVAVEPFTA